MCENKKFIYVREKYNDKKRLLIPVDTIVFVSEYVRSNNTDVVVERQMPNGVIDRIVVQETFSDIRDMLID